MEIQNRKIQALEQRVERLEKSLAGLTPQLPRVKTPEMLKKEERFNRMHILENPPLVIFIIILAWLAADKVWSYLAT